MTQNAIASANGLRPAASGAAVHFSDLDVWKQTREFTTAVYALTAHFPDNEKFGLISQMRRAAISISSNIAEGWGRESADDKKHFYTIARGSALELESQLLVSQDLDFIDKETLEIHVNNCHRIQQMLYKLIKSMKRKTSSFRNP